MFFKKHKLIVRVVLLAAIISTIAHCDHKRNAVQQKPSETFDETQISVPEATAVVSTDAIEDRLLDFEAMAEGYSPITTGDIVTAVTTYGGENSGLFGANRTDEQGALRHHRGMDIYAEPGQPVFSPTDGTIVDYHWNDKNHHYGSRSGGGLMVVIKLDNGERILMMHLDESTLSKCDVTPGRRVTAGEMVGVSGRSGNTENTGVSHIHIQLYNAQNKLINPSKIFNMENVSNIIQKDPGVVLYQRTHPRAHAIQ